MNNYQVILQKMLSNNQILQNPMIQNALQMSKNNDISGLQKLAENIASSKGTNVDTIRKQLGI